MEEPDFKDNLILEKGEVLTSLYEKMNSARAIAGKDNQKVIRPDHFDRREFPVHRIKE